MTEKQRQVILAMADNDMRVFRAAKSLHRNHNGLYGHFDRIYEETGLDARNFYDLVKLVEMAKEECDGTN